MEFYSKLNWEIFTTILAGIPSFLGFLYLYSQFRGRGKETLKLDLEILSHFSPEDENHQLIKKTIDKRVKSIYADYTGIKLYHPVQFAFFLILLIGVICWSTFVYSNHGANIWFYILCSYILNFLILTVSAFSKEYNFNKLSDRL